MSTRSALAALWYWRVSTVFADRSFVTRTWAEEQQEQRGLLTFCGPIRVGKSLIVFVRSLTHIIRIRNTELITNTPHAGAWLIQSIADGCIQAQCKFNWTVGDKWNWIMVSFTGSVKSKMTTNSNKGLLTPVDESCTTESPTPFGRKLFVTAQHPTMTAGRPVCLFVQESGGNGRKRRILIQQRQQMEWIIDEKRKHFVAPRD